MRDTVNTWDLAPAYLQVSSGAWKRGGKAGNECQFGMLFSPDTILKWPRVLVARTSQARNEPEFLRRGAAAKAWLGPAAVGLGFSLRGRGQAVRLRSLRSLRRTTWP